MHTLDFAKQSKMKTEKSAASEASDIEVLVETSKRIFY